MRLSVDGQERKMPDISEMRGMGEPLYFSFNMANDKARTLLCHAVIFTSFVADNNRVIHLADIDDDPRMPHFCQFLWNNSLKDARAYFDMRKQVMLDELKSIEEAITASKKNL